MESVGALPKAMARAPARAPAMVTKEIQTDITGHTSGNGMPYPGGNHVQVVWF